MARLFLHTQLYAIKLNGDNAAAYLCKDHIVNNDHLWGDGRGPPTLHSHISGALSALAQKIQPSSAYYTGPVLCSTQDMVLDE